MLHIVAFLLSLCIDYAAVKYVLAASRRNLLGACGAAFFSGLLFVLGYYSYKLCFTEQQYVISTVMGHMTGSFLGVLSEMLREVSNAVAGDRKTTGSQD